MSFSILDSKSRHSDNNAYEIEVRHGDCLCSLVFLSIIDAIDDDAKRSSIFFVLRKCVALSLFRPNANTSMEQISINMSTRYLALA